jgi:large subunit ribosomal protein L3
VFDEKGVVTPVTIVQAGPCYVTQVKSDKSDGYSAIQMGFGEVSEKRLTKGQKGHLGLLKTDKKHPQRKKSKDVPPVRHLREFRTSSADNYQVGQVLTVEQFEAGDHIDVTGTTKGRGFAGTIKRHGFGGGPKTHGQSDRWRAPGSVGATSGTAHVFKGKRMSGHYGNVRYTAQNLQVVKIDPEKNLLAIKGSVPGPKGSLVIVRDSVKS